MALRIILFLVFGVIFLHALSSPAWASNITVQYFHMSGCHDCAVTDPIIKQAERDYLNVTFDWVDVGTSDGLSRWERYQFTEVPAIVINNETRIPKENLTDANLNASINVYLNKETVSSNPSGSDYLDLSLAFSMGVFSGFSPCMMAILGFILTYTAGSSSGVKDGMKRAMVFGSGLVTAYILLGVCILAFGRSFLGIGAVTIIAGIVSILIGLNMLGIFRLPFTVDNYVKRSAQKYVGSWPGLFFLGLLFSMVKVPCAAPFLLILISEMLINTTINSVFLLLSFAVGVLTPFAVIGLIGGYALSERVRSYRVPIKTISGLLIILLGIWIMI